MAAQVFHQARTSTTRVSLRFINKTQRHIKVIWCSYDGDHLPVICLGPNECIDIDTYTKHPWIFEDSTTKDRMHVMNQEVFYAEKLLNYYPTYIYEINALLVPIRLPLYSLKMLSILKVRDLLPNSAAVQELPLPVTVKRNLCQQFHT